MAGQKVVRKSGQNLVRNGWSEYLMYCFVLVRIWSENGWSESGQKIWSESGQKWLVRIPYVLFCDGQTHWQLRELAAPEAAPAAANLSRSPPTWVHDEGQSVRAHARCTGSRKPGVPEAARARPLAAAGSRLRLELLSHRPEPGPQRLRRRRGAPPNLSTHWRGLPDRPARRRSLRAAGRSAEALPLRVHDDILRGRRWRPATAAPTSAHAAAQSGFWSKSGQKMAGQKVVRN